MKPPVVILAAGASERLGQCKALVDLGGESALARLIASASNAGASEIAVVTGAHDREIAGELARLDACGHGRSSQGESRRGSPPLVRRLFNPHWERGRTGSLMLAASHFPDRALLVAPIDVPLVQPETIRRLFEVWDRAEDPPRGWLAACLDAGARFGHPIILGRELAARLAGRQPSSALALLRAEADPLWAVRVSDPAILDDLDTPDDLKKLRTRLGIP